MKEVLVIDVVITVPVEKRDEAQVGTIKNRPSTRSYTDGWERVFGKKQQDQTVN